MRKNKCIIGGVLALLLIMVASCSFVHYAPFEGGDAQMFTCDMKKPYKALGLIHTEAWTWGFFYYGSPMADLGKAKNNLAEKARTVGADAIVNVKSYVVTRMPIIPFIFG